MRISTFLRGVRSPSPSIERALWESSSTSAGSTTTSASVSSPSSRSSGFVNAAWAGPRRPMITTSSMPLCAITSIA